MDLFDALCESGRLAPIDVHFARLLRCRAPQDEADLIAVTAALLSRECGRGRAYLDLGDWAGRTFADGEGPSEEPPPGAARVAKLPSRQAWERALAASPLVGEPDRRGGAPTPLVCDAGGRVYLWRCWRAERRAAEPPPPGPPGGAPEPPAAPRGPVQLALFDA